MTDSLERLVEALGAATSLGQAKREASFFALLATYGGWRGRKHDPISPLTSMRGLRHLVTALELIDPAPGLLRQAAARWR